VLKSLLKTDLAYITIRYYPISLLQPLFNEFHDVVFTFAARVVFYSTLIVIIVRLFVLFKLLIGSS